MPTAKAENTEQITSDGVSMPDIPFAILRDVASKGSTEPFLTSIYFVRRLTPPISAALGRAGISANAVTSASLICAIAGALCHASSGTTLPLVGSGLLLAYNVLDHVDGEVARISRQFFGASSGPAGSYYDALVHYLYTPILFFSIGYSAFLLSPNPLWMWSGLVTGMWLSSYSQAAAYRVVMDVIVRSRSVPESFATLYSLDKVDWAKATRRQRWRFFQRELFSSQGQIFILLGLSLYDYIALPSHPTRHVYLCLMAGLGVLQIVRNGFGYFSLLDKLK